MVAGSLVVIGAAVVLLRTPADTSTGPTPVPAPQTTVADYAREGVVVPGPDRAPKQPERLTVTPGPNRLNLAWSTVPDAAGYEIRWNDQVRLVALTTAQLDGLENGRQHAVEVRSVGKYGQRSLATINQGTPEPRPADDWTFADEFDDNAPHPTRWRFTSTSRCGTASPGTGADAQRLVVTAQCGSEPVSLAARTPLKLTNGPGELGRFVIDTDQPGLAGELLIDLVPGQVDQVGGGTATARASTPGKAQDDQSLPPGTIRVRITARAGAEPTTVQVLVGPSTPRQGTPVRIAPVPTAGIGVTVRWEVVLHTDGVRVLREGAIVGAGDVVPAWREATAVVGMTAGRAGVRAAVDFVGYRGAPTATPPLMPAPALDTGQVVAPSRAAHTPSGGARVSDVTGARLLLTLVPQNGPDDPADDVYAVEIGGRQYPTVPAVAGQRLTRGVRYPVVAQLPADALVLRADGRTLPLRVRGPQHPGRAPTRVLAATLELIPRPGATLPEPPRQGSPQDRTRPALARPDAVLLDAAGTPLTEGTRVPRGRLVLEVTLDGVGGQLLGGELAGLAGVEVRLDRNRLAGIPTVVDGPGTGGTWRIAVDTTELPPGRHSVEVRAVGVDPRSAFAASYTPFEVV